MGGKRKGVGLGGWGDAGVIKWDWEDEGMGWDGIRGRIENTRKVVREYIPSLPCGNDTYCR